MGWEDGDYFEELATRNEELPAWICPWCNKETELWFDRSIEYLPDGTEIGMKDRCVECGNATDELPHEDTWEVENDGG